MRHLGGETAEMRGSRLSNRCRVVRFDVSLPEYEEGRILAQLLRFRSLFVISQPLEFRCLRMHHCINYYNKLQIIIRNVFFIQQIQLQKVKSCRTVNTLRLHCKEQSVSACEEVIAGCYDNHTNTRACTHTYRSWVRKT